MRLQLKPHGPQSFPPCLWLPTRLWSPHTPDSSQVTTGGMSSALLQLLSLGSVPSAWSALCCQGTICLSARPGLWPLSSRTLGRRNSSTQSQGIWSSSCSGAGTCQVLSRITLCSLDFQFCRMTSIPYRTPPVQRPRLPISDSILSPTATILPGGTPCSGPASLTPKL